MKKNLASYTCIVLMPYLFKTHFHFYHYLTTNANVHLKIHPLVVNQSVLWSMWSSMEKRTPSLSTTLKALSP